MKRPKPSVSIHCWWPNWNMLAVGLLLGGPGLGAVLASLVSDLSWKTAIAIIVAVFGMIYWWAYCCITVTPWAVQVRGSGFLKPHYSSPMNEVMLNYQWALGEPAGAIQQAQAGLYIGLEEDWDTGVPYLELQFYGEDIPNCFRVNQYPQVQEAITSMLAQREDLMPK